LTDIMVAPSSRVGDEEGKCRLGSANFAGGGGLESIIEWLYRNRALPSRTLGQTDRGADGAEIRERPYASR